MSNPTKGYKVAFFLLTTCSLIAILTGFAKGNLLFLIAPFCILGALMAITQARSIYYLLWVSIPLSIDYSIGTFTLTLFSEPLMIALLAVLIGFFAVGKKANDRFMTHPLVVILGLQLIWMVCSIFYSVAPALSIKYFAAKLWFFAAFIFIPAFILQRIDDFRATFWALFASLSIVIAVCVARHAAGGFGFGEIGSAVGPFFANHVGFSTLCGLVIPFVWYASNWYYKHSLKNYWIHFGVLLFLVAIAISYTRTTWLSLPIALVAVWLLKKRLFPISLAVGVVAIIASLFYLSHNNKYLDFAPDYNKTFFNKGNFEKHLEATYKLEDVSGMERVYRWVAATNMIKAHPFTGTGTNTFYPEYKRYTITAFKTNISDNQEHSTTHNYFLMVFSEQGIIGFSLFVILYILLLWYAHKIYHRTQSVDIQRLTIATYFSLIVFLVHLMLGDMVESDKTGSVFLFCIALIIKLDIWSKESVNQKNLQESKVISSETD